MGFIQWLKQVLFTRDQQIQDGIPEIMGYFTDEEGQRHAVYRSPRKHKSLTPEQLQRVERLRDVLYEVYPLSLEGWLDGFMRDEKPEKEIQIIEAIAIVYLQLITMVNLSTEEKKQLYGILCLLSAGPHTSEIDEQIPAGLPDGSAIFEMYREARMNKRKPE